jgi:hypothetical protein
VSFGAATVVSLSCAPVAQLDRANASGALGREFESLRAHQRHFPPHKTLQVIEDPTLRVALFENARNPVYIGNMNSTKWGTQKGLHDPIVER